MPEITQLRCRNTERSEDLRRSTQLRSGSTERSDKLFKITQPIMVRQRAEDHIGQK